ncbi:monocarboxylate transporter 9 isoform X3 [Euwallacea fornicatus]|uniref:monocarboxylate transporter 9 isoform X3 n=1 Tax=Euwallacea fornicatus TaxID=995702 RepID=UPI00338E8EB4
MSCLFNYCLSSPTKNSIRKRKLGNRVGKEILTCTEYKSLLPQTQVPFLRIQINNSKMEEIRKQDKPKQEDRPRIVISQPKPKRRRMRVGDPDFTPPDGGWGWLIVFACGFSNLSTFPMFQQFGLVFRSRFKELQISTAQTTSVINMNSAFNAGMGLLNGPLFRKFTYRQMAMFGSLLVASSLFLCQFCDNFWEYMILYSALYGSGIGITQSSNALALNTYFKKKRRVATGFSWTTTGLGPIVWPYIIVALNSIYGVEGTLLIFSGFALHAFVCSLVLHPVQWHTKFRDMNPESAALLENGQTQSRAKKNWDKLRRSTSLISSQYLHNEDDPVNTGYEICDPGTPMMTKYNDGWYSRSNMGSRQSLTSNKSKSSRPESKPISAKPSASNLTEFGRDRVNSQGKRKVSQINKPTIAEEVEPHDENREPTPPKENKVLREAVKILTELEETKKRQRAASHELLAIEHNDVKPKKLSIWKKISIFFDFELFKDPIYLNLMLGITVANFAELNFSILTPMVLQEFKFSEYQTATFMSLLGGTDLVVRFFIPFIADKLGWDNKTFFLIGVLAMAFGRVILVHTQTYIWSIVVAVIIGAGKGLRTIFIALVIPSYVPLERLPAASGLQLATSGLLFIILGPVVGWIRDAVNNYVITLHILNICTYTTAVAWLIEGFVTRKRQSLQTKTTKSFKITK